ncbi:hypothetical protein GCM10008021_00850 [Deinococcus wulumuqiensis]|uniref:Uncharacterized protein n=1 Tax=Deinococcus wulumuqiensis TaxID=980427 RepID=A0ABQ2PT42_9DEIO|nr:hypothetical protein GCM10008021_00850 [Deinococcus wulumuqiensis]
MPKRWAASLRAWRESGMAQSVAAPAPCPTFPRPALCYSPRRYDGCFPDPRPDPLAPARFR